MEEKKIGPLLSDEMFFEECLDLDYAGMEAVKACTEKKDWAGARKEFAAWIRKTLDPDRFFTIPYEVPENIYTYPGESEEEACRRICDHTLISVGVPCVYGKGNPVDWEANPTENGYREWTWQLSRHPEWKLMAHRYRETGEKELAEAVAELFTSWVRQAVFPGDCPGYETKCWRTIECGIRMGANWPYVLFTFYNTEAFTDDVLIDWYKSVWEHGDRLSRNHWQANWLIMEMNGLTQIGIIYPMFKKSKEWLAQGFASLEEELDRQVYQDGFQFELSTNYHDVVINNYQRMIEVAQAFEQPVPEQIYKKLENVCQLDIKLMMPNRYVPDLNDGAIRNVEATMKIRQQILPDYPPLRWMTQKDEAGRPDYTSIALPWAGFMAMRTGWTPEDTWALLDAAPFGKAHQHEDKLSVLFYANGKLLLTEAGNYAYDDSEMRRYVLSTRSHNTVRVDGQDQNRRRDYEWKDEDIKKEAGMTWNCGEKWDYAEGSYTEGYGEDALPVAVHNRRVFFSKGKDGAGQPFLVIVDRLASADGAAHSYECLWHIDSSILEQKTGSVSFEEIELVHSAGEAEVITGQEEPEWQGFIATGHAQGMYRAVPCVSVKTEAVQTRIVTVLVPAAEGKARPERVTASAAVEDEEISIRFTDGSCVTFRESDVM